MTLTVLTMRRFVPALNLSIRSLGGAQCQRKSFSTNLSKAKFVRFRITEERAIEKFTKWMENQFFAPSSLHSGRAIVGIRAVFLPFWFFTIKTNSTFTANVLKQHEEWVWNGRSHERIVKTFYKQEVLRNNRIVYSSDAPDLQIYASYQYKRDLIQSIKIPATFSHVAENLSESMLRGKEVDARQMDHASASRRILKRIQSMELQRAKIRIQEEFGPSIASDVKVHMDYEYHYQSIYLPAYVIEYRYLGKMYRAFVSGFHGSVEGTEIYSPFRIAIGSAVPLTLLYNILGARELMDSFYGWFHTVVIPTLVWVSIFMVKPVMINFFRDQQRNIEELEDRIFRQTRQSKSKTDQEYQFEKEEQNFHHADDFFYERAQRASKERHERYQRQYWSSKSQNKDKAKFTSERQSSLKLYEVLGISRNATVDEINRSFRALALKYHPDLHPNLKEKEKANRKFKEILKAYQTLRDPQKRAKYDATGFYEK